MKEACDSMSSSTLWMSSIGALSVVVAETSRIADPGWARDLTVIPSMVRVFHSADTGLEHNETAITPLVASHCMSPRSVLVGRLPVPSGHPSPPRRDNASKPARTVATCHREGGSAIHGLKQANAGVPMKRNLRLDLFLGCLWL